MAQRGYTHVHTHDDVPDLRKSTRAAKAATTDPELEDQFDHSLAMLELFENNPQSTI